MKQEQEQKVRKQAAAVAFEVEIAEEIREVAELTGIPAARIRAQVVEEITPQIEALVVGKIHAMVVSRQADILRRHSQKSLEAGS